MSAWKTAAGPPEPGQGSRLQRDRQSRLTALTGLSWPGSLASMRSWLMDQAARDLGIRSELEIRRSLEAEVTAKRWTRLDRL
jgi:hypothetical protein